VHYERIWETVEETQIVEKVLKLITNAISEQQREQAESVLEELRTAVEAVDMAAISRMEEAVYTQRMRGFANQQLALLRLGDSAAGWEQGLTNLMRLVEKYSNGSVPVKVDDHQGVTLTTLALPSEAQMVPVMARLDGILMLSTSPEFISQSIEMLKSGEQPSKFDDPRLVAALARLPQAEDMMVFYDGKLQFEQLGAMGDFIRQAAGNNEEAGRVADILETIFREVSIVDYEVTVEYTEGDENHTQVLGKFLPEVEQKMLYRAIAAGEPFEDWQTWVPKDALAYSVQSGVNLHTIYDWALNFVKEEFPEAHDALEQFAALQQQWELNVDDDLLQSFTGACVSITLPPAQPSMLGSPDSVMALRCKNPEKVSELIHRGMEILQSHPVAKAQQLRLVESAQIEGFEEVASVLGAAFGVTPTFGFDNGWMFIGSNATAIQRVLAVRSGEAESIADSPRFVALAPQIEGPVSAVSYSNLGAAIRNGAKMIGQAGAVAQIAIGVAGMQPDAAQMKSVQEVMALLPDIGRIVAKFDFYEEQFSVSQPLRDQPGTYMRQSVIKLRSPSESDSRVSPTSDSN
jgi:hypothetical protein